MPILSKANRRAFSARESPLAAESWRAAACQAGARFWVVQNRIERLVLGPYLELFARSARAITLTNAQRHSISEMLRKTAGDT